MSGIVGIAGRSPVAARLYDALTILHLGGREAAGITCLDNAHMLSARGPGLVRDVFDEDDAVGLTGEFGIGHVRSPDGGGSQQDEIQPMYVNSPCGISLANNGNLVNSQTMRAELFAHDRRPINTRSAYDVLLNQLAHEPDRKT